MAVFLLVSAWQVYVFEIDAQESRVAFIGSEIQGLDARIAEIRVLQKKRKELLDRMRVIQELQGNRPVSVRLFDELARQLPKNVFYERLTLSGKNISVAGVDEDNKRISNQLRSFDRSLWFSGGNVTSINAFPAAGAEASRFALSVVVSAPSAGEEGS